MNWVIPAIGTLFYATALAVVSFDYPEKRQACIDRGQLTAQQCYWLYPPIAAEAKP